MKKNKKTKNIVSTYWNGEISLGKSFWIVAVVILGIYSIPSYIIDDQFISSVSDGMVILIWVYTIFFYVLLIYVYVGLWRSASKYISERIKTKRSTTWGYVTYTIIVLGVFSGVSTLILDLAS
tara:strand:+ start:1044 stop:1412 length:369 start_codon:yes stop_codon:yes gene_type:complete